MGHSLGGIRDVDCRKEGTDLCLVEPAVSAHTSTEIDPVRTYPTDSVYDIHWSETTGEKHRHLDRTTNPALMCQSWVWPVPP